MSRYAQLPEIFRRDRKPTAIDEIAHRFYHESLELSPEEATAAGFAGHETEYGDYSPEGRRRRLQLVRRALTELDGARPVDDTDRVTLDAMRERLGLEVELAEAGLGYWEINNIASPVQSIRAIFDLMARGSEQDWQNIALRMKNVPAAISGYIESLEQARGEGKVSARRQIEAAIEQTDAYISDRGFFVELAQEIIAAAPGLSVQAQAGAAAAITGYATLNAYLREVLLPLAQDKDAVGAERYSLYSRQFLGTSLDLEETYAWGVAELDRITAEQTALASEISPGATVAEAKRLLDNDPDRTLRGTEALRQWMQKTSDSAVDALAGTYFEIAGPMRELQCMIAPTHEGGIYYTGPSVDFSRPGRMWWSVPEGEETFGTWREKTTVYHEGVPGHHLQISVATAMAATLNDWRAHGCWVSGHGEGWALYAEQLMDELGFLSDPADRMGMLDAEKLRAARVVFDIGLHCGFDIPDHWVKQLGLTESVWTAENGLTFLQTHLDLPDAQLRFEFLRYLGWPGQAPSYKVGQRVWNQLRENARATGTAGEYDRLFHTRALMLGSVGLDTLNRALRD